MSEASELSSVPSASLLPQLAAHPDCTLYFADADKELDRAAAIVAGSEEPKPHNDESIGGRSEASATIDGQLATTGVVVPETLGADAGAAAGGGETAIQQSAPSAQPKERPRSAGVASPTSSTHRGTPLQCNLTRAFFGWDSSEDEQEELRERMREKISPLGGSASTQATLSRSWQSGSTGSTAASMPRLVPSTRGSWSPSGSTRDFQRKPVPPKCGVLDKDASLRPVPPKTPIGAGNIGNGRPRPRPMSAGGIKAPPMAAAAPKVSPRGAAGIQAQDTLPCASEEAPPLMRPMSPRMRPHSKATRFAWKPSGGAVAAVS